MKSNVVIQSKIERQIFLRVNVKINSVEDLSPGQISVFCDGRFAFIDRSNILLPSELRR